MGDPLRDRHLARDLAEKGQILEIFEEIGGFAGLSAAIAADLAALDADARPRDWRASRVVGKLSFGLAEGPGQRLILEGRLEARIAAVCQRCLTAFEWPLESDLCLQLSVPGEAPGAHGNYELWELDDAWLRPIEIVDEALIMAMPLSAKHQEPADCIDIAPDRESAELVTPFASLRAQIDEQQNDS